MKGNKHSVDRREFLWTVAGCLGNGACTRATVKEDMIVGNATIDVKVLAYWMIQEFSGQAVLAGIMPRFVVCLLIKNTQEKWKLSGPDGSLATHRVGFFATESITKGFAESDVLGQEVALNLSM